MEVLPARKKFTSESSITELENDEAEHMLETCCQLRDAWKNAVDVNDVCKIALTITKVLETRRRLLLGEKQNRLPGQQRTYLDAYVED